MKHRFIDYDVNPRWRRRWGEWDTGRDEYVNARETRYRYDGLSADRWTQVPDIDQS